MRKLNKFLIMLLVCVLTLGALTGCTGTYNKKKDKLNIVTTIFPLYDFARAVGGSNVNIKLLVRPGTEVHSYEPTPQDIIDINEADVFLYIGGENDVWVDDVLESVDNPDQIVVKLIDFVDIYDEEHKEGMAGGVDDESEPDEHIWTSPKNAIAMVEKIAAVFEEARPNEAEHFRVNAERYIEEIAEVQAEFQKVVDEGSLSTVVFGDRFPLLYLVNEYGLDYRAAFSGCSAQCEENAATIVYLMNYIKENDIPVVYYLEMSKHNIADVLAEETGAEICMFHSCQTVTKEDFDAGKTYVSIMRENVESLRKGLR